MSRFKKNKNPYSTFMFGNTQSGQLGVGYTTNKTIDVPMKIDLQVQLVKITCGAGHSVALSENGRLYSWGLNVLGQLGQGDTEPRWSPTLIRSLKDAHIVEVASGAGHSVAIDQGNMAYSWGASADFQTGIYIKPSGNAGEDTKQIVRSPQRVEALNSKKQRIVGVACGMKHTVVLSFCSRSQLTLVTCFGGNQYGQCGNGEHGRGTLKTNFDACVSLKGKSVSLIECGAAHTMVKTLNNELYSFGLNDKGQLGLGIMGNFTTIPHKMSRFTSFPVTKMSCSEESSSCLTSNGDLYIWGRNTDNMFDGEGGMFATDDSIMKPTLVSIFQIYIFYIFPLLQLPGLKVLNMSMGPKSLIIQRQQNG